MIIEVTGLALCIHTLKANALYAKCDLAAVDTHPVDDFFFASMLIWP